MVYGLWLSAAGMAANQYRQNIAANNLANVDTVGFKHDLAMLVERPIEADEDAAELVRARSPWDLLSGGTHVTPTVHHFDQGPTLTTGKPLDIAVEGPGFLQVRTEDGIRYTRDGRLTVTPEGTLVTAVGGHAVLSDAGAEITVDAPGPQPEIVAGGVVRQGGANVATIGVVEFGQVGILRKQGANLFAATADAAAQSASNSKIVSGAVEGATMDPVTGLVDMIEAARAFQMNANMLSLQDNMIGRAVNEIARV